MDFMFDNITVLKYTEEAQVTVSEVHCLLHLEQVKRSHLGAKTQVQLLRSR